MPRSTTLRLLILLLAALLALPVSAGVIDGAPDVTDVIGIDLVLVRNRDAAPIVIDSLAVPVVPRADPRQITVAVQAHPAHQAKVAITGRFEQGPFPRRGHLRIAIQEGPGKARVVVLPISEASDATDAATASYAAHATLEGTARQDYRLVVATGPRGTRVETSRGPAAPVNVVLSSDALASFLPPAPKAASRAAPQSAPAPDLGPGPMIQLDD